MIKCSPTEFNALCDKLSPKEQHDSIPCSRYATTSRYGAVWATACYLIARESFGHDSDAALEEYMSHVVNDTAGVAYLIHANWFILPRHAREAIGHSRHYVKGLV